MSSEIDAILAREAADTLERLAFIFASEEEAPESADPAGVTARVRFHGPFEGSLILCIDEADLPELTANMLGLDEGEPIAEAQQQDALKETLNIICGNVLPAVAGRRAVFDIDPPEILETAALDEGAPAGSAVLALDEGVLILRLHLQGDPDALLRTDDREAS